MKCEACGGEMVMTNSYKKGRHNKELHKCVRCGKHIVKNGSLIPNVKRVNLK